MELRKRVRLIRWWHRWPWVHRFDTAGEAVAWLLAGDSTWQRDVETTTLGAGAEDPVGSEELRNLFEERCPWTDPRGNHNGGGHVYRNGVCICGKVSGDRPCDECGKLVSPLEVWQQDLEGGPTHDGLLVFVRGHRACIEAKWGSK